MSLIRLSKIEKSFQDGDCHMRRVLTGVNLEVESGEFVAIRGDSGSGKTTLLSILGTLIQPDKGSYQMDGLEMVTPNSDHSFARNKDIGFVFQDHRLLPQYTTLENILLPTLAYATEVSGSDLKYARELLSLTHIPRTADKYPATLSGGEACRVAICRALIRKPYLLLADEPTGQLDRENARNIIKLFSSLCEQLDTTVIMVTHSDALAYIAHRELILKGGILQ